MALYTGKGDKGTTKLFDSKSGERVSKTDAIFEALGTVDELNTVVGWCRAGCATDHMVGDAPLSAVLLDVQHHLFTVQAELAGAPKHVPPKSTEEIEARIEHIEGMLPEITTFFVPGASELSSRLDIARAVARRAERRLIAVHEAGDKEIAEPTRVYANRLSSLMYALTRLVNEREGISERPPEYRG